MGPKLGSHPSWARVENPDKLFCMRKVKNRLTAIQRSSGPAHFPRTLRNLGLSPQGSPARNRMPPARTACLQGNATRRSGLGGSPTRRRAAPRGQLGNLSRGVFWESWARSRGSRPQAGGSTSRLVFSAAAGAAATRSTPEFLAFLAQSNAIGRGARRPLPVAVRALQGGVAAGGVSRDKAYPVLTL
jgi:hypothetical protein